MKYPSRSDYYNAIRNPQLAFRKKNPHTGQDLDLDGSLVNSKPIEKKKANGLKDIWSASGSFAIVFKMETSFPHHKILAVRCFYRTTFDAVSHYRKVVDRLRHHSLKHYFVDFELIEEGIRVHGNCYPILKMEWAEGDNLKKFLKANLHHKGTLKSLAETWLHFCNRCLESGVAHGDLQHGNILVVNRFGQLSLKLLDYDSLHFTKDFRGSEDTIKGLADYQHPLRKSLSHRCLEIDFFSQLVIYLSILALSEDKRLWDIYNLEEREGLLFSKNDFIDCDRAEIFKILSHLPAPIPALAKEMKTICQLKEFNKISSLQEVLIAIQPRSPEEVAASKSKIKFNYADLVAPFSSLMKESKSLLENASLKLSQMNLTSKQTIEPEENTPSEVETQISFVNLVINKETEPARESGLNKLVDSWWEESKHVLENVSESIHKVQTNTSSYLKDNLLAKKKLIEQERLNKKETSLQEIQIQAKPVKIESKKPVKWDPRISKGISSNNSETTEPIKFNDLINPEKTKDWIADRTTTAIAQLKTTQKSLLKIYNSAQHNLAETVRDFSSNLVRLQRIETAKKSVKNNILFEKRKIENTKPEELLVIAEEIETEDILISIDYLIDSLESAENDNNEGEEIIESISETYTTLEVAERLNCSISWCNTKRYQYPERLALDIHYYKDAEGNIQWTEAGFKELESLKNQNLTLVAETMPTAKVSKMLGVSSKIINEIRIKYLLKFIEGTHYSVNAKRQYFWTKEGIELLKQTLVNLR
jgi:hypothetical protein